MTGCDLNYFPGLQRIKYVQERKGKSSEFTAVTEPGLSSSLIKIRKSWTNPICWHRHMSNRGVPPCFPHLDIHI